MQFQELRVQAVHSFIAWTRGNAET